MVVDETERRAGSERIEGREDARVPVARGERAHVERHHFRLIHRLRGVWLNDLRLCYCCAGDEQDEIGLRRRTVNDVRGERQEHPGPRGIGRILRCQRALTAHHLNRDWRRDAMVAQMLPRAHTDQEHLARQRRLQLHRGRVPVVKSDVPFERDQVFVHVRVHATFPASPVFAIGLGMPPR